MLKIGITGQNGFIGSHLFNTLGLYPEEYLLVKFERHFFNDNSLMDEFVNQCDVIIHLAAINRHTDSQVLNETNVHLVKTLIESLIRNKTHPHVLFSSSTQEKNDSPYGNSKREGRLLLEQWAKDHSGILTALIIPNIFGPFCLPNYNSVVATFCDKISKGEETFINTDSSVKLLYVGDLVYSICELVKNTPSKASLNTEYIGFSKEILISDLHEKIVKFKMDYQDKSIIPLLVDDFELKLFNTFRSYIDLEKHNPVKLNNNIDKRGNFVELVKLNVGGQVSFSTTMPNITRGNHFHTRKIERFIVIKGNAQIQLRRIGSNHVMNFDLDGESPSFVDMPIWYTHNIKNTGSEPLYTIFWINEFYDPDNADTYFEIV